MPGVQAISGLSTIHDRYDGFVFDLWGVLHDGKAAFPEVPALLRRLRGMGKKTGILSNSPRPAAAAAENIRRYDLAPDCYDTLLTSGQLAYEALRDRPDPWLQALGHDCLSIGPAHEFALYEPLGLRRAVSPEAASFVLVTGLEEGAALESWMSLLQACLRCRLPLLCANPDEKVVKNGKIARAAGTAARFYAEMGGDVRADFGKPHPAIFARMLGSLGTVASRTLMIGDNLKTDIAGACVAGMGTLWITGGVHRAELTARRLTTAEKLQEFLDENGATADYAMQMIGWDR